MTNERLTILFQKYYGQVASPSEEEELFQWLASSEDRQSLLGPMEEEWRKMNTISPLFTATTGGQMLEKIFTNESSSNKDFRVTNGNARLHFLKTTWFRYAAVLLLIAGTAMFLYITNRSQKQTAQIIHKKPAEILPGGNKAVLTLSDGSTILLDSAANGSLAQQGTTTILKTEAGALAYQSGTATGEVLYNTISTPKGGQYRITLPDGSKVWLNAASSIHFPTAFVNDRKLTVTGEVYLEVAKDKSKPFHVQAGEVDVQVLGTSFNINAYADDKIIKTTLMEGSVQVSAYKGRQMLVPGQQAQVSAQDAVKIIKDADIEKVMAWKNGLFNFNGADLQTVMNQLERWYDIQISYNGTLPNIEFQGELNRGVPLSDIVLYFKKIRINCKTEGRKLIIM